ncbi:phosphodiesterase [Agreia bicolorata]|uniref:3',5'-cyclic-nucleotide phosphodiesterase n=1 Tax=Agreia bicolorata TaxID=110935 RepID=A0ABR5CDP6_9MICO|nr:phosphodiesterase [Agreia bicolorata]KJC63749.1 3',5'-cyclic-nucleotide phosphodiesterase [Agreia bicolorata]
MQLGQYPPADHVLAHISDTHFLGGRRPLYGSIDTDANLSAAMAALEASRLDIDALVFTGDIADLGEPDAYGRVRAIVEPAAARMGAEILWVMGNHDDRSAFRAGLLDSIGDDASLDDAPIDRVVDLEGLRVITLDTSVPGYHHGELAREQLEWLREQLAVSAPHGTILSLHHPPIPSPVAYMQVLELQRQHELAEVVRGSDIRAILGGHLHYSTHGLFAGIPVAVAAATCYTMDVSAPESTLVGRDGGQSITLVHAYADQVVHSIVPLGDFPVVARFDTDFTRRLEAADPVELREYYAKQQG